MNVNHIRADATAKCSSPYFAAKLKTSLDCNKLRLINTVVPDVRIYFLNLY